MARNGIPIGERSLRHSLNTGITYAAGFEQWEAAVAASLDLEQLHQGGYDNEFLAYVVAWWRARNQIAAHQADAREEHARRGRRKN